MRSSDRNIELKKFAFCFIMPYHISEGIGGGAEVQAWLLAKELARRGYRVAYIAKSIMGKAGQITELDGVTIRWIKNSLRFQWLSAPDYYRALCALAPEIVIQRMTSFETGLAAHYCKRKKVSFMWVCTDNATPFRWTFLRKQRTISQKAGQPWYKKSVSLANALFMDLSRHYGIAHTTVAFTQNEFQRNALLRSYGLESSRMISGHEPPNSWITPEERLAGRIVLWVSNLGENKRPRSFIDLARRNKGNGWRFIMIGGKDDESYVRELFQDKPDNLEWLGRLPFNETLSWFDRATWFVNTSVAEGFPNTYIQAWLRGVPVLSLEADPDGVIAKNGLGEVCDDVARMGKQIELSSRKEIYIEMTKRVSNYAAKNHSVVVMADRFLEALRSRGIWNQ